MTAATHARWVEELLARSRTYWTDDRLEALWRGKRPIISPREGAPLLRALGLTRDDTSLPPAAVRKYFQINHMVAVTGPPLRDLRARREHITLVDAGCGRSYLTLLLAWCAQHVWKHSLEVIGIDRDPDVIAESRRRAELAGLSDRVRFEVGDVAALAPREVHAVVALHACDTATCDALALAMERRADLVAVAPCCQAELARGWSALAERGETGAFAPVWQTPQLRRETAADVTDAMRVALVRSAGYDVTALEFVPAEHTRKNTLICGIHRGAPPAPAAATAYAQLRDATGGVDIQLARRLGLARA